jgi:hypothetical protein
MVRAVASATARYRRRGQPENAADERRSGSHGTMERLEIYMNVC